MASQRALIGLLATREQAEDIVIALRQADFSTRDISVLFPDKTGSRDFAHEQHTKAPEGAVAGASAGGVIGGTLGLLAGIGTLAIPGLGPFIAAGPIMAALSGGAAGATLGGITGALVGMGIPEIEAKQYEGRVAKGSILISVHVENPDERTRAKNILTAGGALDIKSVGEQRAPQGQASTHR
jgi:hypothetical protein